MKRLRCLAFALLLVMTAPTQATVYLWTGLGNGWSQQIAPPNDGTGDLEFYRTIGHKIELPSSLSINSLRFRGNDDYLFYANAPVTLTLANGVKMDSNNWDAYVILTSNITVNLAQSQMWDIGNSQAAIAGTITGTGPLTLRLTTFNGNTGTLIINNQNSGNTYTGGTVIESNTSGGTGPGVVSFWNTNSPFGTGQVTITNGAIFSSHGTNTLSNAFVVSASSTAPWYFRAWDAALTLSGSVTLSSDTTIGAKTAWANRTANGDNTGLYVAPGPMTRHPTIFTGSIGEQSGSRNLTVGGPGVVIFNPTAANTYSGGTNIYGSLIFANANALPSSGTITAGLSNTSGSSGYAGWGDSTPGSFATFLSRLSPSSSGAVGVDTLPGNSTVNLSDAINLSVFTTTAQNGIRLGTATSAIISGAITPQGNSYHFGNGGGDLYVTSALVDAASPRSVIMDNAQQVALKLYLQGTNTYTGGTMGGSGFIIFDSPGALPSTGNLTAFGTSTHVGAGYIGYTDQVTGLTPANFLARFDKTNTWGVIGFDSSNRSLPVTINGVDLTGFNDGVYIGTSSAAILTGTLHPTTAPNPQFSITQDPFNWPNVLRLTAGNGGTLTVNSTLADINPGTTAMAVLLGAPPYASPAMSDGTVILNGNNTYTGGTLLTGGIRASVGHNNAFGTGTVYVSTDTSVGLTAAADYLTISNPITFATPDYYNTFPGSLTVSDWVNLTLNGQLTSGPANPSMGQIPGTLIFYSSSATLGGDNSGFHGNIELLNSSLTLTNNHAAGSGSLYFKENSTVEFSGSATAPELYGIRGNSGYIVLPNAANLTIHTDSHDQEHEFGGVISGFDGTNTTASLTVTAAINPSTPTEILYLSGSNRYTGGTTITGQAALGLGSSGSAGTGTITINAPEGGLALNSGVTLINNLVFTQGGLAGLGTFAPAMVNGVTHGPITIGTSQTLFPGIPGNKDFVPGKLTFSNDLILASGGRYEWGVVDATTSDGFSTILINGTLDLSTLGAGQFIIEPETYDFSGMSGFSNITNGTPYTFTIAEATGGITGFNASVSQFTFDLTNFQNGTALLSSFSVTADTNHLYLNFVAVPEPSTWILILSGIGLLWLFRRRAIV